ncbi:MAG: phenylalanine--tRNA ligase subunit beta [Casimicrobiaceae bacterium]
MKFSERWLRTLVDPPLSSSALQDSLTMAGLEVEATEAAAPPFSGVVVGHIERVDAHPGADRLRVCHVDGGRAGLLQVVCGAPNAASGTRVPLALPGATLPGGSVIAKATVRGVESSGMLCSALELGISEDGSGLLALPADAPIGTDVRTVLALDDTIITLKLTPNRADCLSLLGIAREVQAITGAPLRPPDVHAVPVGSEARRGVRVDDPHACPRFASRIIEAIDPSAPTPPWMRQRLGRSGIRAISAIVDVTNYVMLELGQPLHAYDDALLEGEVVVRFARAGEVLQLLNEQTLALEPDLLLVADARKPLGLAGIMGGEHSGISARTTTVFLEAAFWNPEVIQGKSRRLGFTSDAGYRFERGVDPELGPAAVERATALILAICGGRAGPLSDVCGRLPDRATVLVRPGRIARLLGIEIPPARIADYYRRLGCAVVETGDGWRVTPPSHRFDLAIEEDYVEEAARLYGYDHIPASPSAHVQRMLPASESERPLHSLRRSLVARDWQEVVTFSFVSSATESTLFPGRAPDAQPIRVLNPIAQQLDVMRTTLAGGLLEVLGTNLARRDEQVRIFEVGRCFERRPDGEYQPLRLGGLAYGHAVPEQWGAPKRLVDLFDVKGDLEAIVAPANLTTATDGHPILHPGRSARVDRDGQTVGWLGELHPRLVRAFEFPRAPVVFEVDLAALLSTRLPETRPLSRLPRVRRDIALVVDEPIAAQTVIDALMAARPANVAGIELFDVYRGSSLGHDKKSLAILVLIHDTERTLTDAEIDAVTTRLVQTAIDEFGAALRR